MNWEVDELTKGFFRFHPAVSSHTQRHIYFPHFLVLPPHSSIGALFARASESRACVCKETRRRLDDPLLLVRERISIFSARSIETRTSTLLYTPLDIPCDAINNLGITLFVVRRSWSKTYILYTLDELWSNTQVWERKYIRSIYKKNLFV